MSKLRVYLFGPPRFTYDGKPVEVGRRKAIAIISYLAVTKQSHSRDTIATLLWPDYDQSRAQAALRRDLAALNKFLPGQWLAADRETIGIKVEADLGLDIEQFRAALALCQTHDHPLEDVCSMCLAPLTEAVEIYQDDLMS